MHFTFFVSGVNFIADGKRNLYEGPHQRAAIRRISFGGSPEQVRRRVDYVNDLYRNGHEIASHAVGHFNGAAWSSGDWDEEFRAFGDIVNNVGPNNALAELALGVFGQRRDRLPRALSRQGPRPLRRAQGPRLSLRHQRGRPRRCLARAHRRHLAVQSRHAADSRLGQGYAVDGLQFLRRAVAGRERPAPRRGRPRADAANLPALLQAQLHRQPRAAPHRPSLHRLSGRCLQRGAQIVCARESAACPRCAA